ncbi:hypothetical protein ACFQE1_20730, partial [Halobium palmae]
MATSSNPVYDDRTTLDVDRTTFPRRPDHGTVMLVRPTHFDVRYRINPYMGGRVDGGRATEEWEYVRETYERYADRVVVLDPDDVAPGAGSVPVEGLPDIVFG